MFKGQTQNLFHHQMRLNVERKEGSWEEFYSNQEPKKVEQYSNMSFKVKSSQFSVRIVRCCLSEDVILLTSLVDWVFGHICYVLSRVLRETREDS